MEGHVFGDFLLLVLVPWLLAFAFRRRDEKRWTNNYWWDEMRWPCLGFVSCGFWLLASLALGLMFCFGPGFVACSSNRLENKREGKWSQMKILEIILSKIRQNTNERNKWELMIKWLRMWSDEMNRDQNLRWDDLRWLEMRRDDGTWLWMRWSKMLRCEQR